MAQSRTHLVRGLEAARAQPGYHGEVLRALGPRLARQHGSQDPRQLEGRSQEGTLAVSAPRAGRTVNQPRGLDEKEGERVCCRNASTGGKVANAPRAKNQPRRGAGP